MIPWLDDDRIEFPPPHQALGPESDAPGLLAAGSRLDAEMLKSAYRQGIFPWYSQGQPVLWWCPDPRMVLQVSQFRISPSLRKTLRRFVRSPQCEIRIDHDFESVLDACAAAPRYGQTGTWITPRLMRAYTEWHRQGVVHSFETWIDGELVGGLYGVGLGRMFFGESMFMRRTDASKIALAALVAFCRSHDISWIDCQQNTPHLASLGAGEVPRASFLSHLERAVARPDVPLWTYDHSHWRQLGVLPDADGAACSEDDHS